MNLTRESLCRNGDDHGRGIVIVVVNGAEMEIVIATEILGIEISALILVIVTCVANAEVEARDHLPLCHRAPLGRGLLQGEETGIPVIDRRQDRFEQAAVGDPLRDRRHDQPVGDRQDDHLLGIETGETEDPEIGIDTSRHHRRHRHPLQGGDTLPTIAAIAIVICVGTTCRLRSHPRPSPKWLAR